MIQVTLHISPLMLSSTSITLTVNCSIIRPAPTASTLRHQYTLCMNILISEPYSVHEPVTTKTWWQKQKALFNSRSQISKSASTACLLKYLIYKNTDFTHENTPKNVWDHGIWHISLSIRLKFSFSELCKKIGLICKIRSKFVHNYV